VIHLPAQPTQGSGHPASIQSIQENHFLIISLSQNEDPKFLAISKTGSKICHPSNHLVESCFGSHHICNIFFHTKANAAETFETVVDFHIHHFQ
jgi:hypothetical protein